MSWIWCENVIMCHQLTYLGTGESPSQTKPPPAHFGIGRHNTSSYLQGGQKKCPPILKWAGVVLSGTSFVLHSKLFVWIIVKCTTVNDGSSQNADYNVRDYFCVVIWHCFVTNVIRVDSIVTSNKTSNLQRNTVITSTSSYCRL